MRAPRWKVYDGNKYMASCHQIEAAAHLVALYGPGATIRSDHPKRCIVWTEGEDGDGDAGESYDYVAETVYTRAGKGGVA